MSTAGMSSVREFLDSSVADEEHPVTVALPPSHLQGIGAIVAYFSTAEWMLAGTICMLLGIDRKQGRIATGEPSITDAFDRIMALLELKKVMVVKPTGLISTLKECERTRNRLGHGVWVEHSGTGLCLQVTRGTWNFGPPKDRNLDKRLYPEGMKLDQAWFDEEARKLLDAIAGIEQFHAEIRRALGL